MGLRLLVAHSPAEKDAARDVEARVFLDAFGNTPEIMQQEYGPYADRSRFIAVIDDSTGHAAGAIRLILPDHTGELKTLTDVARNPWNLAVSGSLRAAGLLGAPLWDVATLAVDPSYRGTEVTLALCHGLFRHPQLCGVRGGVTILDDRILRLVRAMGVPWTAMPGATSQSYLGSPASTPCALHVEAVADSIRTRRPDLAPALVEGTFNAIELDPADLLPGRGAPHVAVPVGRLGSAAPAAPGPTSAWTPPRYSRSRLNPSQTAPHSTAGESISRTR